MIAHASKDENGKYKNGKAGDQLQQCKEDILTGEVCVRKWYNRPWTAVYKPPTVEIGEKVADNAVDGARNRHIGYDQNGRNTIISALKNAKWKMQSVTKDCECDCSSFATACVIASNGSTEEKMIVNGNCATSRTIGERLKKSGWTEYKDSKYLTSPDYLGKGWILVYAGHHVAINLLEGDKYGR